MGYFADVFSLYETKPMKRSRSPRARPRPGRNGSRTHQSLQRGLSVLEAIAATGGVAALAEVVRRTALPRSTAHHLVRALVDFGYLDQDGDARPYRLAPRLLPLTRPPPPPSSPTAIPTVRCGSSRKSAASAPSTAPRSGRRSSPGCHRRSWIASWPGRRSSGRRPGPSRHRRDWATSGRAYGGGETG